MSQITFEGSYRQVYRNLYRLALYTLGGSQDVEGVVSDAVVSVYQSYGELRNREVFRAWIFKVLTTKCKRKLKKYVNKTVELKESGLTQEDREWTTEGSQDVRGMFFTLNEEEWLIISISVFGGYSNKEIGRNPLIRNTTVCSKLSQAFDKIRRVLEGQKGGAYGAG